MVIFFLGLLLFSDGEEQQATLFQALLAEQAAQLQALALPERIVQIAASFEGKPYIERSLEVPGPERLIVRLDGFDCFTLVESVMALALSLEKKQDPGFLDFTDTLKRIRYRQGTIEDYTSRLHYTCDWAYDNLQKGILLDVSKQVGGVAYEKKINFMTQHRDAYRQLADDALFSKMPHIEAAINARQYHYLPENLLEGLEQGIQPGDILAITTNIKGLDISHVGFARFVEGRLHLLHASSKNKRVETSKIPLTDMLQKNKRQTGIMVFRLKSRGVD